MTTRSSPTRHQWHPWGGGVQRPLLQRQRSKTRAPQALDVLQAVRRRRRRPAGRCGAGRDGFGREPEGVRVQRQGLRADGAAHGAAEGALQEEEGDAYGNKWKII